MSPFKPVQRGSVSLDVEVLEEWRDRLLLADADDEDIAYVLKELRWCLTNEPRS